MYAVTLLITSDKGILAVTRKGSDSDWGLIGGKVESNETLEEAIIRETKEETGLVIKNPTKIYTAKCGRYTTAVFTCSEYSGDIIAEPGTKVDWVPWAEILVGTFGSFNQDLYTYLYTTKKLKHLCTL